MFVAFGLFFIIKASIPVTINWVKEQSFEEVKGILTDTQLNWEANDKEEYVYTLTANYDYKLNGQIYTIKLVETDAKDSTYHAVIKREKEEQIEEWETFPEKVFHINPEEPNKYQEPQNLSITILAFIILLPTIFVCIGLLMIIKTFTYHEHKMKDPSKPWLEKKIWQKNHIACDTVERQRGLLILALFWNMIAFTSFGVAYNNWGLLFPDLFFVGIFPFIGLIIIFYAFLKLYDFLKNGTAHLALKPFPAAIGGHFGGIIQFQKMLPKGSTVALKLSCIKVSYSNSSEGKNRKETLVWQSTGFAFIEERWRKEAQFKLEIPSNLPASTLTREGYLWTVISTVSYDNHHFERRFEIPVFKTGEKSILEIDSKAHTAAKEYASELINEVTEFAQQGDEYTLNFPNFRILKISLFFGLVIGTALLGLSIYSILYEFLPFMLSAIFGFIGFVFFGLAGFEAFYTLKVQLSPKAILVNPKWLGIPFITKKIPRSTIKNFTIGDYVRSDTNDGKHTAYYKVSAIDIHNKSTAVAIRLKNKETAEQMKHFFETYFSLDEKVE